MAILYDWEWTLSRSALMSITNVNVNNCLLHFIPLISQGVCDAQNATVRVSAHRQRCKTLL